MATQNNRQTTLREKHLEYWTAFNDYLRAHSTLLKPKKAQGRNYMDYPIGHKGYHLCASVLFEQGHLGVSFEIEDAEHSVYGGLLKDESEINRLVDQHKDLDWRHDPARRKAKINLGSSVDANTTPWATQHEWMCSKLEAMVKAFRPRLTKLL